MDINDPVDPFIPFGLRSDLLFGRKQLGKYKEEEVKRKEEAKRRDQEMDEHRAACMRVILLQWLPGIVHQYVQKVKEIRVSRAGIDPEATVFSNIKLVIPGLAPIYVKVLEDTMRQSRGNYAVKDEYVVAYPICVKGGKPGEHDTFAIDKMDWSFLKSSSIALDLPTALAYAEENVETAKKMFAHVRASDIPF